MEESKNSEEKKELFLDEETIGKFSKSLFKAPKFGYICGLFVNLVYLYCWIKKKKYI